MKKLSVITVTYNCVSIIQNTVESVIDQSQDDVEHIIIDGGSVDGTIELINKFKHKLAYFISEPDRGIYDAMNKGIEAASGEWILFLNAGDVFYEKNTLRNLKWDWPIGTEFVFFSYLIEGDKLPILPDVNVKFGLPTSHQAMFISSSIAKRIKLNSSYRVAADYEFFLKRYKLNKKCVHVENNTLSRVLPGGYSRENIKTMVSEYQKIIFNNLGMKKAFIYYFCSRPLLFKIIKEVLPVSLFNKLKNKFPTI